MLVELFSRSSGASCQEGRWKRLSILIRPRRIHRRVESIYETTKNIRKVGHATTRPQPVSTREDNHAASRYLPMPQSTMATRR